MMSQAHIRMRNESNNPELTVPIGTHVVTRVEVQIKDSDVSRPAGSVGLITSAPAGIVQTYDIRLSDGSDISLRREQFSIRKRARHDILNTEGNTSNDVISSYIIYKCTVGSRAYGLEREESDTDSRGIFLPPAEMHWSLNSVPEQLENKDNEECYWELQKFLMMALKANPNILECLYTPLVVHVTPLAQELLDMRSIFLSKLVYQTYNGYVMSQFKKLEQDIRTMGEIQWKHAMHLIRLLSSGVTVLKEEYVPVNVSAQREMLLAIRRGEMPWEELNELRLNLHKEFDAVFATTRLPDRPDVEKANAFLIKARKSMVAEI